MDFYSSNKRTKIIRYILAFALLISWFIYCYTSYYDIELKYIQHISQLILIIALIFSIFNPNNKDK